MTETSRQRKSVASPDGDDAFPRFLPTIDVELVVQSDRWDIARMARDGFIYYFQRELLRGLPELALFYDVAFEPSPPKHGSWRFPIRIKFTRKPLVSTRNSKKAKKQWKEIKAKLAAVAAGLTIVGQMIDVPTKAIDLAERVKPVLSCVQNNLNQDLPAFPCVVKLIEVKPHEPWRPKGGSFDLDE